MSWLKLQPEHHENAKIDGLTSDAYRLWSMLASWASRPENWDRHGLIPVSALQTISRGKWSARRLDRLAQELAAARGSGKSGKGLIEPRDGAWQLHDFAEYEPPRPKVLQKDSAKLAGRRSAEVRKALYGTAQPNKRVERRPEHVRDLFGRTSLERLSNVSEPLDLVKININLRSEDLTGCGAEPGREAKSVGEQVSNGTGPRQAVTGAQTAELSLVRTSGPPGPPRPPVGRSVTAAELDAILAVLPREYDPPRATVAAPVAEAAASG